MGHTATTLAASASSSRTLRMAAVVVGQVVHDASNVTASAHSHTSPAPTASGRPVATPARHAPPTSTSSFTTDWMSSSHRA